VASALALSLAVGGISGCRKKQLPSERYTEAHELFTKLYVAQLDDAFSDPQMSRVEELLKEVPENSSDYPDASALARRIREGRKKLQEAESARRAAAAKALASGPYQRMFDGKAPAPESASAEDAGASQPSPHMPLAEFTQRFSGCFRASDKINLVGKGMVDSWELKDIANCRDRHPGFDQLFVLTDSKEIVTSVAKSLVEYRLPDGGLLSEGGRPASTSAR
jgi:hypothetical protein